MKYDGPDVRSAIIGAIAAVAVFAVTLTPTHAEGDAKPMAMPVDDGHAQPSMAPASVPPPKAAPPATMPAAMALPAADTRKVLYYRNPVGLPDVSPTPKSDLMGLSYLPVYEGEEPADPASDPLLPRLMQPSGAPKQAAMPVEQDHAPSMAAPASIALPTAAQPAATPVTMAPPAAEMRKVLYYRNPMGLSDVSPTPKKDSMGMDYVPVYEGEASADPAAVPRMPGRVQPSGVPAESAMATENGHAHSVASPSSVAVPAAMAPPAAETRKVLYYRNPMGLSDVSPTPKKDSMGMDYVPVYDGEGPADPASVPSMPGRVQPSGVPARSAMRADDGHAHSMASPVSAAAPAAMAPAAAEMRKVLYYRNPMGLPDVSPTPKKDSMGMDYVPVYDGEASADPVPRMPGREQPSGGSARLAMRAEDGHAHSMASPLSVAAPAAMAPPAAETRKVLYYRNPMGLSDVSPTPKKDSMGMDYVPVYDGEGPADPASVRLTPGRIQRSGVRTQAAEKRVVVTPVRGFGTLTYDESAVHTVTVGLEGTVDELFVNHVGEKVRVGQPLFRIWSNQPQLLQIEVARRARGNADQDTIVQTALTAGSRNLNRADWPSPATGVIVAKRVFAGQHVVSTDELLRIADPSRMWVIVDIAERDVARIVPGQKADVVVKTGSAEPLEGTVLFIYPEIKPETRTARVCLGIANPREQLKAAMYADVTIRVDAHKDPVVAVPESAIIDDGERRHVLIDQGDGHFAPRTVVTGAQGQGYTEILWGVAEGEIVVTSANFLIDSDANIGAALAAFSAAARN